MKTNVQTWFAPMWPFKSLPMPFFSPLLKRLLLSITVIRLIPVRYLTAREGDASALAVLWSARFSWENEWTNKRRSALALESTAVCTYFPLRGLLVKTLGISISWSKIYLVSHCCQSSGRTSTMLSKRRILSHEDAEKVKNIISVFTVALTPSAQPTKPFWITTRRI